MHAYFQASEIMGRFGLINKHALPIYCNSFRVSLDCGQIFGSASFLFIIFYKFLQCTMRIWFYIGSNPNVC